MVHGIMLYFEKTGFRKLSKLNMKKARFERRNNEFSKIDFQKRIPFVSHSIRYRTLWILLSQGYTG
jgi:hypothetical protein